MYGFGPSRVGSVFDVVEWPFKTAASAVDDVVSAAPGGDWIKKAFDRGETWLGDLARWDPGGIRLSILGIPLGQGILLTISGNLAAALGTLQTPGGTSLIDRIGPALAEMSWAMPTYLAQHGDCFTGAYVQQFATRAALLIKIIEALAGQSGGDQSLTTQVPNLINDPDFQSAIDPSRVQSVKDAASTSGKPAPSTADALASLGASPDELAAKFQVRADAAALAINLVFCGEQVYDVSKFDLPTGAEKAPLDRPALPFGQGASHLRPIPVLPGDPTSAQVLQTILDAQHAGARDDQLVDLTAQYQTILAHEQDPSYVSPAAMRIAAAHGGAYAAPIKTADALAVGGTLAAFAAPLLVAWGYIRLSARP